MKRVRMFAATAVALGALLAIAPASAEAPEPTPTFDNVTVVVAQYSGALGIAWEAHAKRIKDLFGINMEIVGIPVNELFDKEMLELSQGTGAYDLVQFNPGWMGDYVDFLRPLDDYIERWDPAWMDIHEGFRVWMNTYEGKRYTLTMDGDILFTYYNKTTYEDPGEQAAFKAKYGRDLTPPRTWEEVIDIQEFFRRDTDGDGAIDHWGYSDPIIKRGRGFYAFLLRYINYASPDPQYFDPETMKPAINSEAGILALENYMKTVELGPPGMLQWEWDDANVAFMQGTVETLVHWPNEGFWTDQYRAQTGDEMGFAMLPGVESDGKLYTRSMTGGGWIMGLAKDSQNPEAAYTVLKYMLSPEVSTLMVMDPKGATDIFRYSTFEHPAVKVIAPEEFLTVFKAAIEQNFPELRMPGGFEYYDTLDIGVQKALAGQLGAKEALDEVAEQWEKITNRLGRDQQKEKYAAAMGL